MLAGYASGVSRMECDQLGCAGRDCNPCTRVQIPSPPRAIGAVGARFPDTEEVTGSNPVSPTKKALVSHPFYGLAARVALGSIDFSAKPCRRPNKTGPLGILAPASRTPGHESQSTFGVSLAGRGLASAERDRGGLQPVWMENASTRSRAGSGHATKLLDVSTTAFDRCSVSRPCSWDLRGRASSAVREQARKGTGVRETISLALRRSWWWCNVSRGAALRATTRLIPLRARGALLT